ncbi:DUF3500 domain-containing protein [Allokutzneria oryzae]|uniref:DUF3500 domain-containing protein n=1 Tax=Allokutzneria oryzae TaxID=1378989 RepID=A0ABV6A6P3_9PSEU
MTSRGNRPVRRIYLGTTPRTVLALMATMAMTACAPGMGGPASPPGGASMEATGKPINPTTGPCPAASTSAGTSESESGGASAVLSAATAFVNTLDEKQRTAVMAERTPATLAQWSNLPGPLVKRTGLRIDTLNQPQRDAVMAILKAALSPEGYTQVRQITTADGVLASSGGANLDFGADHYWVRILGTPADTGKWTFQYDGHHLALNISVDGGDMTLAPSFWGAQPASYEIAGTAAEPLCGETVKAFAVMDALDADQRKRATLTTPVKEIVLGTGQDGKTLAPEGITASSLNENQKKLLLDLIQEWITPLTTTNSAAKLSAAKQNLDQVSFAWHGATTIGNPIYYRVVGPMFLIEFAHQQGAGPLGGGITHIHSIYREPGNDYGAQSGS